MSIAIRITPDGKMTEIPDMSDLIPNEPTLPADAVVELMKGAIAIDWLADEETVTVNAGINPDANVVVFAHGRPDSSAGSVAADYPDMVHVQMQVNLAGEAVSDALNIVRLNVGAGEMYGSVWVLQWDPQHGFVTIPPEVTNIVRDAVTNTPVRDSQVVGKAAVHDSRDDETASGADEPPAPTTELREETRSHV